MSRYIAALCGAAAFAAPAAAPAAHTLNLQQATADTKAKLIACEQANIVLIGDSLTFDDATSFRPYFARNLQAAYGDAGPGYLGAALIGTDYSGWSTGLLGQSDPAPHHALDGLWLKAPASATPPTPATIHAAWQDVDLHYVAEPGGGAFDVVVADTGQHITRIDTAASTSHARSFSYSFPQGVPHRLRVVPDGAGPVTLLGLNKTNDAPGVRVHRAANGGWGTAHILRRDFSFDDQLRLLDTDLVMVALGVNDSFRTQEDLEQQFHLLADRIGAAVPDAEIILVAPYDFGTDQAPVIASTIEQVAADRGLGLINLYEIAGSYASFESRGFLSDGLHFTPAGGEYVGNIVSRAFITNGAGMPEPASLTLVVACAGLLLARRRR